MFSRLLIFSLFILTGALSLEGQILVYDDHNFPANGTVNKLCFSADNRFLASGTSKGEVVIWDLDAKKKLRTLKHGAGVTSVIIDSKSRYVVSGGDNKRIIIWDLYSGEKLKTIGEYKGKIRHIAFDPEEKILSVSGTKKEIYLFQFPGGELIGMLRNGHKDDVIFSAFNRAGDQLVSVGLDNQMIYWNTGTKQAVRKSEISPHTINASGIAIQTAEVTQDKSGLIIAYQETKLAKGGKSMIFRYNTALYDWKTGMLKNIIEGNVKKINSISVTPDGRFYITDNSTLRLKKINFWDIQTGEVVKNHQLDGDVSSIAVSSEGNWMALSGRFGNSDNNDKVNLFRLSGIAAAPAQPTYNYTSSGNNQDTYAVTETPDIVFRTGRPDANSPDGELELTGKYFALLIGINDYEDPVVNDLDSPIRDAQGLYNILNTSYSFNKDDIIFLKNPGRADIINALDHLERVVTSNDNLLIFYAGHGHWDEKTGKGYWLPSDAHHESTANWFRNSSLSGYMASIGSRHTLLIADACFSGSIFKTRSAFSPPPSAIQRLYDMPSRKAMTSGTLKEVPDQSVFLKYLMKRLTENNETYLPSEQLFFSLKPAVLNNSTNIPQFGEVINSGDEGGDFIFNKSK